MKAYNGYKWSHYGVDSIPLPLDARATRTRPASTSCATRSTAILRSFPAQRQQQEHENERRVVTKSIITAPTACCALEAARRGESSHHCDRQMPDVHLHGDLPPREHHYRRYGVERTLSSFRRTRSFICHLLSWITASTVPHVAPRASSSDNSITRAITLSDRQIQHVVEEEEVKSPYSGTESSSRSPYRQGGPSGALWTAAARPPPLSIPLLLRAAQCRRPSEQHIKARRPTRIAHTA